LPGNPAPERVSIDIGQGLRALSLEAETVANAAKKLPRAITPKERVVKVVGRIMELGGQRGPELALKVGEMDTVSKDFSIVFGF